MIIFCSKKEDNRLYTPVEQPSFQIPKGILLPKFQREHDIIERTAGFLANQSNQMEILLKENWNINVNFFIALNSFNIVFITVKAN